MGSRISIVFIVLIATFAWTVSSQAQLIGKSKKRFAKDQTAKKKDALPKINEDVEPKQEPGKVRKQDKKQSPAGLPENNAVGNALKDGKREGGQKDGGKKELNPTPMNQQQNFSVSVSDGQSEEALEVEWKNSVAHVNYTTSDNGKVAVKKYKLQNMEALEEKNPRAYQIYKENSREVGGQLGLGQAGNGAAMGFGGNLGQNRNSDGSPGDRRPQNFGGGMARGMSSWSTSGMTNNNGRIQRFNRSGSKRFGTQSNGSGNGSGNGNAQANQLMRQQLQQMLQQAKSPQERRMIEEMLKKLNQ